MQFATEIGKNDGEAIQRIFEKPRDAQHSRPLRRDKESILFQPIKQRGREL